MGEKIYHSKSREDTENIGKAVAKKLRGGDVVAFRGDLGVGKTVFTSGAVKGLGISSDAYSPTFAIVNDYGENDEGIHVYHFDMYRVDSWDSLYSTGFFDYLSDRSILFIEWSENIEEIFSDIENVIYVTIEKCEDEFEREITVSGGGDRW